MSKKRYGIHRQCSENFQNMLGNFKNVVLDYLVDGAQKTSTCLLRFVLEYISWLVKIVAQCNLVTRTVFSPTLPCFDVNASLVETMVRLVRVSS